MTDTAPEIAARLGQMMKQRSGEERLLMGTSMFSFARQLVIESIRAADPEIGELELRRALFLRFYGSQFSPAERERILAGLSDS